MRRYLLKRLIQSLLLLVGISLVCFVLIRAAPGGLEAKFESNPRITAEGIRQLKEYYGLNDPLPIQYLKWLWNASHGDLGRSYESMQPVTNEILRVIPNTLLLLTMGIVLGWLGVPLGIFIARRRGKFADNAMRVVTVAGSAIPHWWLGLLILLWAGNLANTTGIKLIPLPGYNPEADNFLYTLWQLILPSILIAMTGWLRYSRLTRSQVLDVLNQDYIRTGRAKGLSEKILNRDHVLRNALLPLITAFGDVLPAVFGGSIIFENIFAIPGMGKLTFDALNGGDYPVAIGVLMFSTVLVMLGVILADVLYAVVDPRVRYD